MHIHISEGDADVNFKGISRVTFWSINTVTSISKTKKKTIHFLLSSSESEESIDKWKQEGYIF